MPILDEAIMTGDDAYHAHCFKCKVCHKRIEELVFAKTKQGIYCMDCHNERVARSKRHHEKREKERKEREKRAAEAAAAVADGPAASAAKGAEGPARAMTLGVSFAYNSSTHDESLTRVRDNRHQARSNLLRR